MHTYCEMWCTGCPTLDSAVYIRTAVVSRTSTKNIYELVPTTGGTLRLWSFMPWLLRVETQKLARLFFMTMWKKTVGLSFDFYFFSQSYDFSGNFGMFGLNRRTKKKRKRHSFIFSYCHEEQTYQILFVNSQKPWRKNSFPEPGRVIFPKVFQFFSKYIVLLFWQARYSIGW